MARPLTVSPHLPLITLMLLGCGIKGADSSDLGQAGRLITAEKISETGATNAWEAIKLTVREYYFRENRGQANRVLPKRGQGSLVVVEQPLIVVDQIRVNDFTTLQYIPAHQVVSIRVLSHNDAATYYGTNSVAGVIIVQTKMGKRE